MSDNDNPFEALRERGELGSEANKGEAGPDWALLSWMNRHPEALFVDLPPRPLPDLSLGELDKLRGTVLDNTLIGLPQDMRTNLKRAFHLGGEWLKLLPQELLNELSSLDPSFVTVSVRIEARRSFLKFLLDHFRRGGEPFHQELIRSIENRWEAELRSWLRSCLIRRNVAEVWGGWSATEKKSIHGSFPVETVVWVLGEMESLDGFIELLPLSVAGVYEEAKAFRSEHWGTEQAESVVRLIRHLSARKEDLEPESLSEMATELHHQLGKMSTQPAQDEVPDVLQVLDRLQRHHLSGRQAIQACTSCLLWVHQSSLRGEELCWSDGRKIDRWEVQMLLCHHFILNGSSERAAVVYDEIKSQIPRAEAKYLEGVIEY